MRELCPHCGRTTFNCEGCVYPGDPDQLDLFLDQLKEQDRLDEVPRSPSFQREWRIV